MSSRPIKQRTDNQVDLQLLDTKANSHERGRSPEETLLLDRAHSLLELSHVGLVVPRLHVERDNGFGDRLGLVRLLGIVSSDTLGLEALSLFVDLVVLTEEVDFIIVLISLVPSIVLVFCLIIVQEEVLTGAAAAGAEVLAPPKSFSLAALSPGRAVCSASYDLMWAYQRAAWG